MRKNSVPNPDPSSAMSVENVDEFLVSLSGKEYPWRQQQPSLLNGVGLHGKSFSDMQTTHPLSLNLSILDFSPLQERRAHHESIISPLASRVFSVEISQSDSELIMETQRECSLKAIQETQHRNAHDFCNLTENEASMPSSGEWIASTQRENMPLRVLENIVTTPLTKKSVRETPYKADVILETPLIKRRISQTPIQKRCNADSVSSSILTCHSPSKTNVPSFPCLYNDDISIREDTASIGLDDTYAKPSCLSPIIDHPDKTFPEAIYSNIEPSLFPEPCLPASIALSPAENNPLAKFILGNSLLGRVEKSCDHAEICSSNLPTTPLIRKKGNSKPILPSISSTSKTCKEILARLSVKKVEALNPAVANKKDVEFSKCSLSCLGLAWAPNKSIPSIFSPYRLVGKGKKWVAPISSSTSYKITSQTDELIEILVESTPNVIKSTRRLLVDEKLQIDGFRLSHGSEYFIRKGRSSGWRKAKLVGLLMGSNDKVVGKLGDISFSFFCGNEVIAISSIKDISVSFDPSFSISSEAHEIPKSTLKKKPCVAKLRSVVSSYFCITGSKTMKKASVDQCGKQLSTLPLLIRAIEAGSEIPLVILFSTTKKKQLHLSLEYLSSYAHRTAKLLAAAAAAITHRRKNIIFRLFPSEPQMQWTVDSLSVPFPCFGEWAVVGPSSEWRYILQSGGASLQDDKSSCKNVLLVGKSVSEISSFDSFEGKLVFTTETLSRMIIDRLVSVLVSV